MVSQRKKIIVNSIVGLVVLFGVVFIGLGLHNKNQNKGQIGAHNDEWPRIKSEKTITIGLDDTFVPMGFRDNSGKLVGFDIDLATQVFKDLGIAVKWQPIDWSMKETELNTGNIDAIWNGYTATPERAQKVAFSNSYHRVTQVVVTLKKNNINSFADMSGKILADQNSSSGDAELNAKPNILKKYIKDNKAVGYDTFDKAFNDLNAGRIDGLLVDEDYARYYISHQDNADNYQIVKGDFSMTDDVVGFRKGDVGLQKAVNEQFSKLQKNGWISDLEKKWFGQ
ncbi:amino acid ABC transporter substrate-binding protein [Convivina praedatoris]|uniref:L-cystine-binding protein FliY n=1 Tax=Convivina praedatoris TaxID=2880963 RepID=A0ABM9D294_9LACO|nr:amino acid ABC transporter substrate-binding protein [Convivina sp. LMG 32447]CAH1854054.1 L-cystine-binding protein FliY [Convivina sp. LMG 32447]CAH1855326.1 L-cystine-binding protein FliY [Convivina sp. LMG 32447]CAH1855411.1 L-cystine-binding protein FliY [Convivina sp. LMG 32447]